MQSRHKVLIRLMTKRLQNDKLTTYSDHFTDTRIQNDVRDLDLQGNRITGKRNTAAVRCAYIAMKIERQRNDQCVG
jgi:hypothetical protein